jgi:hypothetical protein
MHDSLSISPAYTLLVHELLLTTSTKSTLEPSHLFDHAFLILGYTSARMTVKPNVREWFFLKQQYVDFHCSYQLIKVI